MYNSQADLQKIMTSKQRGLYRKFIVFTSKCNLHIRNEHKKKDQKNIVSPILSGYTVN